MAISKPACSLILFMFLCKSKFAVGFDITSNSCTVYDSFLNRQKNANLGHLSQLPSNLSVSLCNTVNVYRRN